MPVITIPKALRERLGDEAVESFILLLKEIDHESRKDALVLAEEKFERRLSEEVASLKVYIGDVKSELEAKIANMKADLIKWMFLFWAGQIVVLIAILQVFFRK